jgi:hypothetical protein
MGYCRLGAPYLVSLSHFARVLSVLPRVIKPPFRSEADQTKWVGSTLAFLGVLPSSGVPFREWPSSALVIGWVVKIGVICGSYTGFTDLAGSRYHSILLRVIILISHPR